MGQFIFCEMCGGEIPTATSVQEVVIGGTKISDVCYGCAQKLKNSLTTVKREIYSKLKVDMKEAMAKPKEEQPAPAAPAAPASPEQK